MAPSDDPIAPVADDKDWTWVLDEPCPDCGFDARTITGRDVSAQVEAATDAFIAALARPDAAVRPSPPVWSALEYGCHARDVCRLFAERTQLMLIEDEPEFANWDQDETALIERYWEQDPAVVAEQLRYTSTLASNVFAGVGPHEWSRGGRRSNGSAFTVDSLGRYFVHDLVHHVHDVTPPLDV